MATRYADDRAALGSIAQDVEALIPAGLDTQVQAGLAHALMLLLGEQYLKDRTAYRVERTPGPLPDTPL